MGRRREAFIHTVGVAVVSFAQSIEIDRPPPSVWPYLVDWERLDRWMEEARAFRVVGERREGVGVEAEATVRIAGITTRDRVRVTVWDPPRVLELAHLGWVGGRGRMELTPTASGSRLSWREDLTPPWSVLGWLGMRATAPLMRRIFARDLARLRELVESGR
jgi:uncharacterized protein YndB with AHSA1/START domain